MKKINLMRRSFFCGLGSKIYTLPIFIIIQQFLTHFYCNLLICVKDLLAGLNFQKGVTKRHDKRQQSFLKEDKVNS